MEVVILISKNTYSKRNKRDKFQSIQYDSKENEAKTMTKYISF